MNVIINADDFGYGRATSDAILESLRNGWITQTTAMMNRPDVERAVDEAKAAGFGGAIGLHLNLTDGDPLTEKIKSCPLFCGADGKFNEGAVRNKRFFVPYCRDDEIALAEEIEAQARKYISLGLPLLHIDSHSHVHTRIPIARIAFPVLKRLGFKTVRRPYTVGGGNGIRAAVKKIRNALFVASARRSSLRMADGFVESVSDIPAANGKCFELMVHPRYYNGLLVNTTDYETGNGPSMAEFARELQGSGFDLVTYASLWR